MVVLFLSLLVLANRLDNSANYLPDLARVHPSSIQPVPPFWHPSVCCLFVSFLNQFSPCFHFAVPGCTTDTLASQALAYTCYQMYARQKTGLAPEMVLFEHGKASVRETLNSKKKKSRAERLSASAGCSRFDRGVKCLGGAGVKCRFGW